MALASADVQKIGVRLAARDEEQSNSGGGGPTASAHQPLLTELHRFVSELRELHFHGRPLTGFEA